MLPAARPYGIDSATSSAKERLKAKPKMDAALTATLTATIHPVPKRRCSRSLMRLDITVQTKITAEMIPA